MADERWLASQADTDQPTATRPSCMSCGGPDPTWHHTAEGKALLCRVCATLHGCGCP